MNVNNYLCLLPSTIISSLEDEGLSQRFPFVSDVGVINFPPVKNLFKSSQPGFPSALKSTFCLQSVGVIFSSVDQLYA